MASNSPNGDSRESNARLEYGAANDSYLHYDNFSWQVGSVLVVGAFVFWGFLLSAPDNPPLLACANLVVCLLMSAWILYTSHNRELYLWKLHRLRELEEVLGMWQHRRFVAFAGSDPEYTLHWPPGHVIDYFVYALVSLGGPALVVLTKATTSWPWLSVLINLLVVIVVLVRAVTVVQCVKSSIRAKESMRGNLNGRANGDRDGGQTNP
jgi:hypothetical protein